LQAQGRAGPSGNRRYAVQQQAGAHPVATGLRQIQQSGGIGQALRPGQAGNRGVETFDLALVIGYELGVISVDEEATIVFFAIITCLLSPTLFRLFYGRIKDKI
ncbi:MAG: hypothetical protein R6U44_02290, partial [Archaeoglobaceae archaeon]